MRNSEMMLSGLEPVWLHDSSPVICNHIPVRFPPYVPNILPLRSERGKRKKVSSSPDHGRNAGWRGILLGAPAPIFAGSPRAYAAVPALGARYRSGENVT